MQRFAAVALILSLASPALAQSAIYTTLGIHHTDDDRYPGVMVAIGSEDLCERIETSLQTERDLEWIEDSIAFIAVRTEAIGGKFAGIYPVRDDDLSSAAAPTTMATAYYVRHDGNTDDKFKHRARSGTVTLSDANVLREAPLTIAADFAFDAEGPQLDKSFTAKYCPAFAFFTQQWP